MLKNFRKKYIGDRQFYAYVMGIVIPMIVQNVITNFVSMLDNIMVGRIGTAQMSGVSIVNQFIFVFNLTIFGGLAGAGIFGTQFFGKKDYEGQRYTVRFRLLTMAVLAAISAVIFKTNGANLIAMFISKDDAIELQQATMLYGKEYLDVMLWAILPFGVGQVYASVVRECEETSIPMYGTFAAIGVNLVLDYALIFGRLGAPELGVRGAAIATVIAKTIEALVVIIWAHTHLEKNRYIEGLYRSISIPPDLMRQMVLKGIPLLVNEFLWSLSMAIVAQCYSVRGLDVVAARNIGSTMINLFNAVFIQMGYGIGIIVGMKLGAGRMEEARDCNNKLIFFCMAVTTVFAIAMLPIARYYPMIYKTEQEIKELATYYIVVQALAMPIWAYTNCCYFTLRSGGRTGITFLFDFLFSWCVMIPLAFYLVNYTTVDIHMVMIAVTFSEGIKAVIGYFMIRSDMWMRNLTAG